MTIDEFLAQNAAQTAANQPAPLNPSSFDQDWQYQNALANQNSSIDGRPNNTNLYDNYSINIPYADKLAMWNAGSINPNTGMPYKDEGDASKPQAPAWMSGLLAQDPSTWAPLGRDSLARNLPIDEQAFIYDNGTGYGTKSYLDSHGASDNDDFARPTYMEGTDTFGLAGALVAALITGGLASGAIGGAAGGGAAAAGAGAGAGATAGELGGGMLLDTGGMGLTGAGGIGSASSLADAGIAGWGSGAGAAATGAGAGLGAHFSDAGFASSNPELGLDPGYVGSGTGTGWDAGVMPDGGTNPDYSNEGHNYPTSESTQGAGGSPINASTAGTPGLSSLQQKLASQLLKTAQSKLTGGGSGAAGGMPGGSGIGYTPNELSNETPGMMAGYGAPQAQAAQAGTPHFLGGAQQPQFQGVGYMQVPQAQDPSQMMKLAQALQGQDQNYG